MRPARIPYFLQIPSVRALGGLLALVALGCGGQSGPTGITEGEALGKFCHELNRGGEQVMLTLQLGDPAVFNITARTGVCAPMAGMPCAKIPVPPPPSRVNTLFSIVWLSIAPMSSPYEANFIWTPFEISSAMAWTPAAGSPDLWSRYV